MDTEESDGKFDYGVIHLPSSHMLTYPQKFSTTSRKNAPSTARFLTPRCLDLQAADRALALARSTSNTKSRLQRRRLWPHWQAGSSQTAQWWLPSTVRSTSISTRGRKAMLPTNEFAGGRWSLHSLRSCLVRASEFLVALGFAGKVLLVPLCIISEKTRVRVIHVAVNGCLSATYRTRLSQRRP